MEFLYAIGWRLFVAGMITWTYMWLITTHLWCKSDPGGCIAADGFAVLIGSVAWATNRGAHAARKMAAYTGRER